MTNAIIQHLATEQKLKIKCQDLVKNTFVYKERLAVQISDRVIIYSANPEDEQDLKYNIFKKIK